MKVTDERLEELIASLSRSDIKWVIFESALKELQSYRKGVKEAVEEIEELLKALRPKAEEDGFIYGEVVAFGLVLDILKKHLPKE